MAGALRDGAAAATDDGQRSSFLGALDGAGRREALDVLFKVGLGADDSARAPIVIARGTVALRNPELV